MIQRIQTIYLLVAIIIQVVAMNSPVWQGQEEGKIDKKVNVYVTHTSVLTPGEEQLKNGSPLNTGIIVINALIMLLAGIDIFLFKNRKTQLLISRVLILLGILFVAALFYLGYSGNEVFAGDRHSSIYSNGFYMPIISIILFFLAGRAINKDEKLVRSADRLR